MRSSIAIGIGALMITGGLLCIAGAVLWSGRLHIQPRFERGLLIYDRWNNTVQTCTTGEQDRVYGRYTACFEVEKIEKRF